MIYETVRLHVDPARAAAFEAAVGRCADLFRNARGCRGVWLERLVTVQDQYQLRVGWDSYDDHMVHFRGSDAYRTWRERAGPFFTKDPELVHTRPIIELFGP